MLKRGGKHLLAVAPTAKKQAWPDQLHAKILQGLSVSLCVLPEIYTLNLGAVQPTDIQLAAAFLSFEIRGFLRYCRDLWQGASAYQFYPKNPTTLPSHIRDRDLVSVYRGFSHRVRFMQDVGLCLSVDVVHLYADSRTLAERMAQGESWRQFIGRQYVYEFGPRWFLVQLREVSKRPIKESLFPDPNHPGEQIDVFSHTLAQGKDAANPFPKKLQPTDDTLIYTYPGMSDQRQAATTLARLRYQTEDAEVSRLHQVAILNPELRVQQMQHFIATYLDGKIKIGDSFLRINNELLPIPRRVFPIPAQLFGHDRVLESPGTNPNKDAIREMWRTRISWLQDKTIGALSDVGIRSHFLLVPFTLAENEALTERIHEDLLNAVRELSPAPYNPNVVIWDDRGKRAIPEIKRALDEPKQLMERAGVSCAVVILPQGLSRKEAGRLRRHIKRFLYPKIRTKCLRADELTKHLEPRDGSFSPRNSYRSYLRFTALDILVSSGYWLWALAKPLHYDLYVGIDVLKDTAGFTFVGAGASLCRFQSSFANQEEDRKEKLSVQQTEHELYEQVRQMSKRIEQKTGKLPRHLVVHRDGRSFDTEIEGLENAVARLKRENFLPSNVLIGVVEIHKTNAERLRLVSEWQGRVENPMIGSYHILDKTTGVVCTTGFPGLVQGTADPLTAEIVYGDLNIEQVLQDIYDLSVLSWTKPDGIQATPITIKLPDDLLEAVAADLSDEAENVDGSSDKNAVQRENEN